MDIESIKKRVFECLDFEDNDLPFVTIILNKYFKRNPIDICWGLRRCVFVFKNYVIKVPINYNGVRDNDWEGSISDLGPDINDISYPKTKLAYPKVKNSYIPIVFMEYVKWATTKEIKEKLGYYPDWIGYVDCGQVGFTKSGRLVAFDYGIS